MANLTVSAAGVVKTLNTVLVEPSAVAGEVVPAGSPVYKGTDSLIYKAKSDTAPHAAAIGVALNSALAAGQPVVVAKGLITFTGTTIVPGATYSVSATAGDLADDADLVTGSFKTVIAIGVTSSSLFVCPSASGVAIP